MEKKIAEFMNGQTRTSSKRLSQPSELAKKKGAEDVASESIDDDKGEVVSRRDLAAKLLAGAGFLALASCAKDGEVDDPVSRLPRSR